LHAELMVPGLFAAPPGPRRPGLELLLARARVQVHDVESAESWLGRAFGIEPPQTLPAGALTAGAPGFWLRADPVHLHLLRDRAVIVPLSGLAPEHAAALLETLNRHFAGRHEFRAPHPDRWAMSSAPAPIDTPPARTLAGEDLASRLPAAPWPALLNEIQMALHEHPANEGCELPVNGLWLWGAGELPATAAAPWRSVSAEDPLALGLARIARLAHRTPPASANEWLAELPEDGRHLAAFDALHDAFDEQWVAPLLAALRRDRIGMLTLHAPDAGRAFELARSDLRRFWRRPRPLEAHAHR
jgi:hypothetical protein